jgi:hypothetical protein
LVLRLDHDLHVIALLPVGADMQLRGRHHRIFQIAAAFLAVLFGERTPLRCIA